jgi:pseudaminic acid biosynthesis-associated methylase
MDKKTFKTKQEHFWAGEFGDAYIGRNNSEQLLASNINFFSTALRRLGKLASCIEFGANVGMNLRSLKMLFPGALMQGIEINSSAVMELAQVIGSDNVHNCSVFDVNITRKAQLSFTKGLLIHINPDHLEDVYKKLYEASERFILVAEYYNPSPVAIPYRGHDERLFKRDFAGEMLEKYPDLTLVDYGFSYRRDPAFPQDDINWFLMEKIT